MAKKKTGRPTKDKSGKTQEELAREQGVSLATWKRWQADESLGGAELADRKKRAEIQKIETTTEKDQLMLAIVAGEYLPKRELEQALGTVAGVCDQYDSAILSELPSRLAGLTPAKIEKELGGFVDEWKELRSDARSQVYEVAWAAIQKEVRGDLKKAAARSSDAN
tara:strand:+ start:61 stop:558 length:498 start_codon:yes stop_codon:yes gene_type:complete